MKVAKFGEKLKSSIRKHYVRKKDLESLAKEVRRLKRKVAKLESCCEPVETEKKGKNEATEPKAAAVKKQEKTAQASKATESQDKLTRIKGIGPVLEKKLHDLGVTSFSQIASWKKEDIDKISEHLNFKGRVQREEWVKQAAELA